MIENFDYLRSLIVLITEKFVAAKHNLFLVGGVVRDALVNEKMVSPDLDLTTDATPDQIRALVEPLADAVWLQGEKFGTIGLSFRDLRMEITTHRSESYISSSRKPSVIFSLNIEDDLSRRDFTINAMAIEADNGNFLDPFNGKSDLENRVLKTPLDPYESFNDDPLRMLRAARFIARYDLAPVQEIIDTAKELAERILIVSPERIREELFKLLSLHNPKKGFEFLEEIDLLKKVFPFDISSNVKILDKTFSVLKPNDPVMRLSVLVNGVSRKEISKFVKNLRMSKDEMRKIESITVFLNKVSEGPKSKKWSDEEIRRLIDLTNWGVHDSISLIEASDLNKADFLHSLDELSSLEDLTSFESVLTSQEVMELLDLNPGPVVGEILTWLKEIRLKEGLITSDEAKTRVLNKWSE